MSCLRNITIAQFVEYSTSIKEAEENYAKIVIDESISENKKNILLTSNFVKRAKKTFNVFGNLKVIKESTESYNKESVDFLILWYNEFLQLFDSVVSNEKIENELLLPSWQMTQLVEINFGQFIDAKMIVDGGNTHGHTKWRVLQYIMSIFLLKKRQKYNEKFTNELSDQFIRCGNMDLETAIVVDKWWEKLNDYIKNNYTVFQDSGEVSENSDNVNEHMKRWGWINFLKNIAKTKTFDISGSGKNSIDCVRETRCAEVLIWSSEEKEYNTAVFRDMKSSTSNNASIEEE